ncbi:MAG: hypothetical protein HQK72_01785 [Desulfamplus sp.]|nr:hypothetical protein [Desulfamplus sp.]
MNKCYSFNLMKIVIISFMISCRICLASELPNYIPDNLKPWKDWVLHNKENELECIPHFNNPEALECAFPTSITLNLNSKGGEFIQEWEIYHESYIHLPGNSSNWVYDVMVKRDIMVNQDVMVKRDTLDNQEVILKRYDIANQDSIAEQDTTLNSGDRSNSLPALVIQSSDSYGNIVPSVKLSKGRYKVAGRFVWQKQPEYIQIPSQSALVTLNMDNKEVEFPNLDDLGRLWLKRSNVEQKEENRLKVESFRLIDDGIPSKMTLYATLDVAGVGREVKLGPLYSPNEFIPMNLTTQLPAKLESDGTIRIQLKPGRYSLTLILRHIGQISSLTFLPPDDGYWSKQEIWSVVRRSDLRVVEISGSLAIDPRMTSLPEEWKSYPAYMMLPKESIKFKEIKRGDPVPPPDQLNLHRILWLSFDGTGYTVQDTISGNKNSGWRLEIDPLMLPGKVTVDGVEQLITTMDATTSSEAKDSKNVGAEASTKSKVKVSENAGVELRRGNLNLVADSKVEGSIYNIPATGWLHPFQRVTGTLNLPAGWKLISANGIDNIQGTWIKQWSLLDIFIVLIFTIATAKLFSIPLASVAFITMVLLYHENAAPRYIWLFLLLGFVLLNLTAKNSGRLRRVVELYQFVIVMALLLISISYAIQSLRIGIYPQLENRWISMNDAIKNQDLSRITGVGSGFSPQESDMAQMNMDKALQEVQTQSAPESPIPESLVDQNIGNEQYKADESYQSNQSYQYKNKAKGQLMDMPRKARSPLAYLKSEKEALEGSLESKYDNEIYGQGGSQRAKVMQYDPKSLTQTGPGLPLWQPFKSINFSWSGPVEVRQNISFILIGPTINLILSLLRVALIILLTIGMFRKTGYLGGKFKTSSSGAAILIFTMTFALTLLNPRLTNASEIPSPEILAELQNRLLEKDKCFPNCADISQMEISIKYRLNQNNQQLKKAQQFIKSEYSKEPEQLSNSEKPKKSAYLELNLNVDAAVDTVIPLPGHAKHWLPEQVMIDGLNYKDKQSQAQALFRLDQILWIMIPEGKHRVTVLGKIGNPNSFQLPLNIKPHSGKVVDANGWEVQGIQPDGTLDDQLQFKRLASKSIDKAGKSGRKEDGETAKDGGIIGRGEDGITGAEEERAIGRAEEERAIGRTEESSESAEQEVLETGLLPPFTLVERTILLGLDWKVETTVRRLTPTGSAIVLKLPLLEGESVITEGVRVKNGMVEVTLNSEQSTISFESFLELSETVRLYHALSKEILNKGEQTQNLEWTEIWRLDASPIFHVETEGIPVILHQNNQRWYPTWHPLPGEEVILKISKPKGIGGQTMTIEKSTLELHPGQRTTSSTLSISIKSSQGGQHAITIPEKAQLQEVKINGAVQIIRQEGQKVILPITPGVQNIELVWKEEIGITTLYRTPKIDLGISSVNSAVDLHISSDRWTLFVGGEQLMGPAVLFWSKIIVVLLVSIGLAMTNLTPLKFYQWFLLGIGMSMSNVVGSMFVAAWLIVLDMRKKWGEGLSPTKFNIMQLGIAGLTFFSMICLLMAISQGLLGHPSMNIVGNGSSGNFLRWYQDISDNTLPVAWLFSLPMFAYRVAMLAWALWLSFWLLSILKWGWHNFSDPILWAAHSKHDDAVNSNTNAQSESLISDKDNQLQKPKNIFSIKNIFRFGKS